MIRKLILPLFLAFAIAAQAQVSFGVHAGLGFTTVTTPEIMKNFDMSYKSKIGPMVGVTSTIEICDFMNLQPELNFSWRGYKDDLKIADISSVTDATAKINSVYAEIPLMFKFYPSPIYGFNLQIGPQLGILLSRKASISSKHLDVGDLTPKDDRNLDFGFNLGAGYSFYHFDIDLRYYFGLVKTYTTMDHCQNRGLQVILGYNF